jgi:hypothetical protein
VATYISWSGWSSRQQPPPTDWTLKEDMGNIDTVEAGDLELVGAGSDSSSDSDSVDGAEQKHAFFGMADFVTFSF